VDRAITFTKWVLGGLSVVVVARKVGHSPFVIDKVFLSLVSPREVLSKPLLSYLIVLCLF